MADSANGPEPNRRWRMEMASATVVLLGLVAVGFFLKKDPIVGVWVSEWNGQFMVWDLEQDGTGRNDMVESMLLQRKRIPNAIPLQPHERKTLEEMSRTTEFKWKHTRDGYRISGEWVRQAWGGDQTVRLEGDRLTLPGLKNSGGPSEYVFTRRTKVARSDQ